MSIHVMSFVFKYSTHSVLKHIYLKASEGLTHFLYSTFTDIMGLTETFLNKNYPSNPIEIDGFNHERKVESVKALLRHSSRHKE